MTDILIGTNPDNPAVVGSINIEASNEEKAKQLPKPSGYRILCAIPEIEKEFDSGIVKAGATVHYEEVLTTVLFVIAMGPDCYKDPARFPTGPWCKEGDFVLVRPNAGTRVIIHGREFRIINDDSVEAVVDEPRGIRRK
uniref:Co-chaperonin GroES n=1 Tax=uncultured virus TaxID=340016 RepID=A0A221S313_9VIRU|nr:co-chaperonin GroES [uncultured virus]